MGRKFCAVIIFLGSILALAISSPNVVKAFTLDREGHYELGGYVENFTAMRMSDRVYATGEMDRGDLSMFYNTLFLNFNAKVTDSIQFKVIGKGYYEGVYDIEEGVYDAAKDEDEWPGHDELKMKQDFDFREYYMTYHKGNFILKAGRQQIVWGESDALRMSDIINPLDISWYWSFPSWEEIRIPLHSIDMVYNVPGSKYRLKFEGVYTPTDFRPTQVAPYGATWDPGLPPDPFFSLIRDQQKHDLPDRSLRHGSGGARMRAQLGAWNVSLFGYYQRVQDSVNTFDPTGALNSAWPVEYHWPYVFTAGGTFNVDVPKLNTVFRGECAYVFNQPFTKLNSNALLASYGVGSNEYEEEDTFAFMLGFDNNTWIRFLNPSKTFYISGQWFQKFVFGADREDGLVTGFGSNGTDDTQTIFTLLINTENYNGTIKPEALFVHSVTEQCGFADMHLTYAPTYTLSFTLGYLDIWGNDRQVGVWGPIRKNDQAYLKIRWSF